MISDAGSLESLKVIGQVAGVGGLGLGVFLLLYRRIRLPTGTRRHLTLFMWLVWSVAVAGMVCYVVVSAYSKPSGGRVDLPALYTESFSITSPGEKNQRFIEFLEMYEGGPVCLNLYVDFSTSTEESEEIMDTISHKNPGEFDNVRIPLAGLGELTYMVLSLRDHRVLVFDTAGTGVYRCALRGCFDVTRAITSGITTTYYLVEIDVPLELKSRVLFRR